MTMSGVLVPQDKTTYLNYLNKQFSSVRNNENQEKDLNMIRTTQKLLEQCRQLIDSAMKFVQTIAKFKLCEEGKSFLSVLLKRLCCLNPQDEFGHTFLHRAVGENVTDAFLCLDTVNLLLNEGFNVNAINHTAETPLHRALNIKPNNDNIHLLTDVLEVLFDGSAHHDLVNI